MIEHCVPFIAIDNILLQIMFRYSKASLPENYVVHFTHYTKIVILRYYCLAKHCYMYINTIKGSIECECSWEFACCSIKASLSWVSTGFYGRCRSVSVISSLSSNSFGYVYALQITLISHREYNEANPRNPRSSARLRLDRDSSSPDCEDVKEKRKFSSLRRNER